MPGQGTFDGPSQEDNVQGQIDIFERARAVKPAAVVIAPSEPQALRDPLERATEGGLPVVVLEDDPGFHNANLWLVLNDDAMGGRVAAQELARVLHGRGAVALLGVDMSRGRNLARERAVEQEFAEHYPGIHVVQRSLGSLDLTREQEIAEKLLDDQADVDGVIALTSTSTRGAYYAVLNRKRLKKVHLVGFDQDLVQPIGAGEIDGVVAQRIFDMGQVALHTVCSVLRGEPVPKVRRLPPLLITAGNYRSAEVARQFQHTWWDENGE